MRTILLALMAGCAGSAATDVDSPDEVEVPTIAYDWGDPTQADLGDGWALGPCQGGGDAPIACLTQGGVERGVLQHLVYPESSFEALADETDREAGMTGLVSDFLANMATDRAEGCAAWTFSADTTRALPVGGSSGRAYGFALSAGGGETDRTLGWLTWAGDEVHVLSIEALGDGSCLAAEGPTLPPAELQELAGDLDAVAAGSVFPASNL